MPRIWLEKFVPSDGTPEVTFSPRINYEWTPTLGGRSPTLAAVGADYALRLRGAKTALKEVAQESVRYSHFGTAAEQDTQWDSLRRLTGRYGKLYILRNDSVRRWAYAECTGMPELTFDYRPQGLLSAILNFARFTDWFAEAAGTGSATITSSGQTFSVSNSGNLTATRMTIRLRANTSTGFTNPVVVTNNTTGHKFGTSHSAISSNSEVRLDTRRPAVEWSNDDGASYVDDFTNYLIAQLPAWQKVLTFCLAVGSNTIAVTSAGTVNVTVAFEFDVPFA